MSAMSLLTSLKRDKAKPSDLDEGSVPGGLFEHSDESNAGNTNILPDVGAQDSIYGDAFEPYYEDSEMFASCRAKEIGKWKIRYTVSFPGKDEFYMVCTMHATHKDLHKGELREAVNKAVLYGYQLRDHAFKRAQSSLDPYYHHKLSSITCHWKVFDRGRKSIVASGVITEQRAKPFHLK